MQNIFEQQVVEARHKLNKCEGALSDARWECERAYEIYSDPECAPTAEQIAKYKEASEALGEAELAVRNAQISLGVAEQQLEYDNPLLQKKGYGI